MAGVKVIDAGGNEIEVSAPEAQAGFAAGRYQLADDQVRVVSGDNRTGHVGREGLASALADGWQIATEGEAEAKKLRREASGVVGTTVGSAEALARGASLGLSDVALGALGVDSKAARARQEALAEAGTALEIVGGVAATLGTGGGAGAAQAAGRGGGLAARLAGGAGRVLAAPSRLAARAGAGLERTILGEAATIGAGTRIGARAAGEALDGMLGGMGGAVSESVLSDKDLTAEAVLGGALAGAAFGGTLGAGFGTAGAGLSRAVRGLHIRGGGDVGDAAMRKVLSHDLGVDASEISDGMVDAARRTDDSVLGSAFERLAPLSGADPAIAKRVGNMVSADPKRWSDVLNRKPQIEREVAETFQDGLAQVNRSLDEARKLSGGEAKYRALEGRMPKGADDFAPRLTEDLRSGIGRKLDEMEALNASTHSRSYDPGALRQVRALLGRAGEEATRGVEGLAGADTVDALRRAAGQVPTAADSFRAMDRLKRDLVESISSTGGFGKPRPGATTDVVATNRALREIYTEVKDHLERVDLWGDAAVSQKEINAAYSRSAQLQADFKSGATGSGMRTLFQADGTINMRQALTMARQFQRMGGDEVVGKLDEALEGQLDYLRTVQKHYDLGSDGAARVKAAEDAVAEIRKRFQSQAENAAFLDDMESLRVSQGDRSVSLSMLQGIGPSASALIGGAVGGLPGAALGTVAGAAFRPYSTARSMASLLSLTDNFGKRFSGGGLVRKLRERWSGAGVEGAAKVRGLAARARKEAATAGRAGVRAAAFQVGKGTARERLEKVDRIQKRVQKMSAPESLKRAMGPELEVLSLGAPETAAAIETAVQRAAMYLQQHAPAIRRNPYSGQPGNVNPREIDRWLRIRGAIVKPAGVIDRVISGTVTRDEVEALRAVYPRHYEVMVDGITQAMADAADRGKPIPRQGRVALGRLLDAPLDEGLALDRIVATQTAFGASNVPTPEEQKPEVSGEYRAAGAKEIDPSRRATRSQSIA